MKKLKDLLTPADETKINGATMKLFDLALQECDHNAFHALGSLLLAAGSASAWTGLDYEQMVSLISTYFENALLKQVQGQLGVDNPALLFMDKEPGTN